MMPEMMPSKSNMDPAYALPSYRDKYWEAQWLINELEELRANHLKLLKNMI